MSNKLLLAIGTVFGLVLAVSLSAAASMSGSSPHYDSPGLGGAVSVSGGTLSGDLKLGDDVQLEWGTSSDAICEYDTAVTPDTLVCGVGTDSRLLLIVDAVDIGTDWNKAQQTNPTLCVQSADQTTTTDRICLAHNQTDGVLSTDGGQLVIDSASTLDIRDNILNSSGNVIVADNLQTNAALIHPFDAQTVADDGSGTSPAFTITSGGVHTNHRITCNDANGCAATLSETGAISGQCVRYFNASGSAGSVTFADSAGVQETAGTDGATAGGAVTLTTLDNVQFCYDSDRWVQVGRVTIN